MSEQRVGKVLQVIGPVVDVEFDAGNLPNIMSALMISNPAISNLFFMMVNLIFVEGNYFLGGIISAFGKNRSI